MVFGDGAEHRPGEPLTRAPVRDLADVNGEDRPASALDTIDDLGLDGERADEAVEVRDHDDVRAALLDELDGPPEAGALGKRRATLDVQLVEDVDEREPVTVAGRGDTLALLGGRDRVFPGPRDANDTDGAARGGSDGC
jgi:hypothetical protein